MLEVLSFCVTFQRLVARLEEPGREQDAPVRSWEGIVFPLAEVIVIVEPLIHLRAGD